MHLPFALPNSVINRQQALADQKSTFVYFYQCVSVSVLVKEVPISDEFEQIFAQLLTDWAGECNKSSGESTSHIDKKKEEKVVTYRAESDPRWRLLQHFLLLLGCLAFNVFVFLVSWLVSRRRRLNNKNRQTKQHKVSFTGVCWEKGKDLIAKMRASFSSSSS